MQSTCSLLQPPGCHHCSWSSTNHAHLLPAVLENGPVVQLLLCLHILRNACIKKARQPCRWHYIQLSVCISSPPACRRIMRRCFFIKHGAWHFHPSCALPEARVSCALCSVTALTPFGLPPYPLGRAGMFRAMCVLGHCSLVF